MPSLWLAKFGQALRAIATVSQYENSRRLQAVMREAGAQDAHVKLRVVRDDELPCKMRLEFRPDAGKIGGICRIGL